MDQFNIRRENVLEAEAIDSMRMSAAHFHDAIVARGIGQPANLFRSFGDQFRVAEFVHISHVRSLVRR
jgi:hypothetical protein